MGIKLFNLGLGGKDKELTPADDVVAAGSVSQAVLTEKVLNTINDGVIVVGMGNAVLMMNPAAVTMTGCGLASNAMSLDVFLTMKLVDGEGRDVPETENKVRQALEKNENLTTKDYILVSAQEQKWPVSITVTPTGDASSEKIITFRNVAKEMEEEGAQMEFISTASHEMRTPVASIEGYLGLALNPQTATIDERARKYLEEAHKSSKHLGKLFQDLLDATKLDDNKVKVHPVPVDVTTLVRSIADGQVPAMGDKGIRYSFGTNDRRSSALVDQSVYSSVDVDFLREIINNLIENAIKYTPEGGAIWVNVRGDGDKVLINVTDTGIGISPDNLKHIFQKFYRVDNSQTREIGGTGLGLYIVKQRVEAIGGSVWAESSFGEGSTFYVSLPRLTSEEYEKRKQIQQNQEMMGSTAVKAFQERQAAQLEAQMQMHAQAMGQGSAPQPAGLAVAPQPMMTQPPQPLGVPPAQQVVAVPPQTMPTVQQPPTQPVATPPQMPISQ